VADTAQFPVNVDGGLVLDKSVFVMQPGEAKSLINYEPDIGGGYAKLKGFVKFSDTEVTGSGGILGLAFYGNNKLIACRAANVMHGTGGSWTSITTGRTSAGRYDFTSYDWDAVENLAMADGVNNAAFFDGSTLTDITAANGGTKPTAPDVVQEFKGHLFFGGMSNSPHTVKFCAPYDENDFSASSGAGEIAFGSDIISLKPFRDNLIIFCRESIYRLAGSSSADFQVAPVTRNIGCLSHYSVQEIGGDLIFLAPDGLRTIAGTEKIGDTELGTVSKQVQTRLNSLSQDQLSRVSSHVIRAKSQYRLYFPADSDSEANAVGLIAVVKTNLNTGQIGWEFADLKGIKPKIAESGYISDQEKVVHGDYDGGFVYLQESGSTFAGTNMACTYRTADFNMGDVGIRKNMQRVITNYEPSGTVASVNMDLIYDYGDVTVNNPATYDFIDPAGAAFYSSTTSLYGTTEYGAATYTPLSRQSVEGSGFAVALKFTDTSTNPTYTFKGFSLEFTPGARM